MSKLPFLEYYNEMSELYLSEDELGIEALEEDYGDLTVTYKELFDLNLANMQEVAIQDTVTQEGVMAIFYVLIEALRIDGNISQDTMDYVDNKLEELQIKLEELSNGKE